MSLILDALNRSERERRTDDDVPNLATEHYPDSTAPGPSWRLHLLWVALIAALLVIGWLVWDRFNGEAATGDPIQQAEAPAATAPRVEPAKPATGDAGEAMESPEVEPAPAAAAVTTPVAPASVADTPNPDLAEPAVSEQVTGLYQQGGGTAAVAEASPPAEDSAAVPAPSPAAAPASAPPTAIAQPVSEESLDIEALVARAEDELENARLAEHPSPFLADLSQQKKNQIPTLMYSRHDYSSDSKASSVTINGKTLRSGGNVGGGVRVVEILPDSVVLSHQGEEFRLRALNSWVNL